MSTRARILTTIGAAWVVAVLVASVALSSATKRERYTLPRPADSRLGVGYAWRDAYPLTLWWAVVGIITLAAIAGAVVATMWTAHHD